MRKVIYAKYNRTRVPKYQTCTKIIRTEEEIYVTKEALVKEAIGHVTSFEHKRELLNTLYLNATPISVNVEDKTARFEYVDGITASDYIMQDTHSWDEYFFKLKKLAEYLFQVDSDRIELFKPSEAFELNFGKYDAPEGCLAVKGANIDLIFDNYILSQEKWYVIDYEWTYDFLIPLEFVKFRALYYFYHKNYTYFSQNIGLEAYLEAFGISKIEIDKFIQMDENFQLSVHGENRKYIYTSNYRKQQHNIMQVMKDNVYVEKMPDLLHQRDVEIVAKTQEIAAREQEINEKTQRIGELEQSVCTLSTTIGELQGNIINKDAQISQLNYEYNKYKGSYDQIMNSFSWKLTKPIRMVLNVPKCIGEHGIIYTVRYALTGKGTRPKKAIDFTEMYSYNQTELERQRNEKFSKKIVISILVPLYNTPEIFLREMIESVQQQTYANWELCLVDGSDKEHSYVKKICKKYCKKDKRIKYKTLRENKGISDNTNECISMATGEYIALLDHDDVLHLSALYECMRKIDAENADYIYTDEMTFMGELDNVVNIHYKPDYSPDTLRSYNYICHLSVFKKSLLESVGYFDSEYDGSQDYDLILRLTEKAEKILHIPKVLYFWRAHENSVAQDIGAKPYTIIAAKKALSNHLKRVGLDGMVEDSRIPSVYKISYKISENPKVSILIPNKDHIEELKVCLKSILQKSTYKNIEIIIIENNSEEKETFDYYKKIEKEYHNVKVVYWNGEFNYSAINNYGFKYATGEYVLLLNNDIEVISENWIEEMLMFAQRSDVGAVGAMLYYPDDTIQHAGVILGIGGVAGHSHKYFKRGDYGYASRLALAQNLSAVTAACMLMSAEVYREVHGLDEEFKVAFNDVDLCMRIREKGYLIVFTPFAELYHYESKSRGLEDTKEKQLRFQGEVEKFKKRWSKQLEKGDPYYNPNLSMTHEDFSFK